MSFSSIGKDGGLCWLNAPGSWNVPTGPGVVVGENEGTGGEWRVEQDGSLVLMADAKKDIWRRTFYVPTFIKDDAPCLFSEVDAGSEVTLDVAFTLTPATQFDQAGIVIRIDSEHTVKAGIEFVDNQPLLSCVVTNEYSDWSTQVWPHWNGTSTSLRLRVHKVLQGSSLAFEATPYDPSSPNTAPTWTAFRIAHLGGSNDSGKWLMGVYSACPLAQKGCIARFHHVTLGPRQQMVHDNLLSVN
eukprot:c21084_g1_i1.p1 GENE.c21084_g1_i1~~c21084_g1_i1.p1  ORF type:complete len:243 (-),score=55.81 c21084_g1_i1:112-840(-)